MENNGKVPILHSSSASFKDIDSGEAGLTKREYFAGVALIALQARAAFTTNDVQKVSEAAVQYADALLKALEK